MKTRLYTTNTLWCTLCIEPRTQDSEAKGIMLQIIEHTGRYSKHCATEPFLESEYRLQYNVFTSVQKNTQVFVSYILIWEYFLCVRYIDLGGAGGAGGGGGHAIPMFVDVINDAGGDAHVGSSPHKPVLLASPLI